MTIFSFPLQSITGVLAMKWRLQLPGMGYDFLFPLPMDASLTPGGSFHSDTRYPSRAYYFIKNSKKVIKLRIFSRSILHAIS